MSKFGPSIKTAPLPQRPLPNKEILWGSQDGGCNRFPEKDAIWERRYSDNPEPLRAFGLAVSEALERVWIVDEYLLMPDEKNGKSDEQLKQKIQNRVDKILIWLPKRLVANDIRFLTKKHEGVDEDMLNQFQKRAQEINQQPRRAGQCKITIKTDLKEDGKYLHDRFAIIDDELWHFGGTVGGFHASVSAASRGWRASEHAAVEFFEMAWSTGDRK